MRDHTWALQPELTRREAVLGLVYLPFHALALPQLLNALATVHPAITVAAANGILYGLAVVFIALAFGRRLYAHYCIWADNGGRVLLSLARGYLLFMALTVVVTLILPAAKAEELVNPNNEAVLSLTGVDFRVTHALAIFIAPIVEEVLFRGVLFASLREKNVYSAYVVTFFVFALAHLWQFFGQEGQLWLYALQYLPISLGLCYCYEKSGCLWTPILLHMLNNMMAYNMLK